MLAILLVVPLLVISKIDPGNGNLMNLVHPITESTNEEVFQKWAMLEKNVRGMADDGLRQALPMLLRAGTEVEVSGSCTAALFQLISAIRQWKPWSIQMLDAMGKLPSGLMTGSMSDLGAYDQCLAISVPDQFQGKYCTLEIRPPLPSKPKQYRMDEILEPLQNFTEPLWPVLEFMRQQATVMYFLSFRLGTCLPSSCSLDDVRLIVDNVASKIGVNIQVPSCDILEKFHLEDYQIAVICVVAFFILLCLIGSMMDHLSGSIQTDSTVKAIALAFSVQRNLRNLVDTSGPCSLPALHGIKFFSITWIIVGHTYLYINWQLLRNLVVAKEIIKGFAFQAIANAFVSVDSFFFISGLLVAYLTIIHLDKNGYQNFNIPMSIIRRIWRFFPSTAMMVGLTLLLPLLGSGPLWHESIDVLVNACRRTWWANLIFVNNFLYTPDACQPTTWFSASDVQLYLLAVLFLALLYRSKRFGFAMLITMILVSVFLSMAITAWQGLPPALSLISPDPEGVFDFWYYLHFQSYVHLAAYSMGLGMGYFLARHPKYKLNKWQRLVCWTLATVSSSGALYGTYTWNAIGRATQIETLIFSGLHRVAWVAGVAWLTFACSRGYGGYVNDLLSWRGFVPLSRLTFLVYLWHGTIIWVYIGRTEGSIRTSNMTIVWMFFGHLVATYFLAIALHLLYEAPLTKLGRMVLGPKPPKAVGSITTKENGHKVNIAMNETQMQEEPASCKL